MRMRSVLAAVAAVALSATVVAPASADTDVFKDKRGDLSGGFDIHSVRVDNDGPRVVIRSKHRNLRKGPHVNGGSVSTYLDIYPKRKGPELMMAGPVGFDGDFHLSRTSRGWKMGKRVPCKGLRYHVNYKRDAVRFSVPRRCLSRPYDQEIRKIRVNIQASQLRKGPGKPKRDWLPKRRHFSKAVAKN